MERCDSFIGNCLQIRGIPLEADVDPEPFWHPLFVGALGLGSQTIISRHHQSQDVLSARKECVITSSLSSVASLHVGGYFWYPS